MFLRFKLFASNIILLRGWKRVAITLLSGAASVLALPPFDFFPILFISFAILVFLLDGTVDNSSFGIFLKKIPSFMVGWLFGFGYFFCSLWWMAEPLMVIKDQESWIISAILASYWGFATLLAKILWSNDWRRIFALALSFAIAEWLRANLFLNFSWSVIGYATLTNPVTMQIASLVNVYTLTAISIVVFASGGILILSFGSQPKPLFLLVLCIIPIFFQIGFGIWRLSFIADKPVPGINLRIIQPAIVEKNTKKVINELQLLKTYLDLSGKANPEQKSSLEEVSHLIWPYIAFPLSLTESPDILAAIAKLLPEQTNLIMGAQRIKDIPASNSNLIHKSVFVINDKGKITAVSDKPHWFAFSKYFVPQTLLNHFDFWQLINIFFNSSESAIGSTLVAEKLFFLPLVKEDFVFSEEINNKYNQISLIINMSDDSQDSQILAAYKNIQQAQIRAVETGKPVVRVSNKGISAVIDSYGKILNSIPYGVHGIIDSYLPSKKSIVIFGKYKNIIFITLILIYFLLCLFTIKIVFNKNSTYK